MNRDTLGFVASIALLFFAYMGINQYYLSKNKTEAPVAAMQTASPTAVPTAPAQPATVSEVPAGSAPIAVATPFAPPHVRAEDLIFENELLRVQFSQSGGCMSAITLKQYKDKIQSENLANVIENYHLCKALGLRVGGTDLRAKETLVERTSPTAISFKTQAEGLEITKSFDFSAGGYQSAFSLSVKNIDAQNKNGNVEIEVGATSDTKSKGWLSNHQEFHEILVFSQDKLERTKLPFHDKPAQESLLKQNQIRPTWFGSGNLYFLAAFMPKVETPIDISVAQTGYNIQKTKEEAVDKTVYEAWVAHPYQLNAGAEQSWNYDVYLGPKIKTQLDVFKGKELSQAIDYGFFKIVAWPIFYALKAIHKVVGNWGVAIIILTIALKILFFPLTIRAYLAGKKMQKLQPQLNAVKEKYKDDRQKLNQETMAIMAQSGTNPLSGCLPVLPTIPVFFALFSVLQHSFELRHAPFAFWIHDLSMMDPLFITPVALALSYYIQQRLTPMPTMDPAQAKMMQFLPLVFAVFMLTFPSGLVIYSLVNSIMTMLQQQYMMRKYKDA